MLLDENHRPTNVGEVFDSFDLFFLCCFSAELVINALANWFRYIIGCLPSL